MARGTQFRKVLPVLQTAIAVSFGGWGLWLRHSILSQPFWGSTGWNSTARFHVWPWPFKFAAILNMPAFLCGLLYSWPVDDLHPGLPVWVLLLPSLILVLVLWHMVGSWVDRRQFDAAKIRIPRYVAWGVLLLLTLVSVIGALVSLYIGFIPFGVAVWLILGTAMAAFGRYQKKPLNVAHNKHFLF
jgi:hypothetical protein